MANAAFDTLTASKDLQDAGIEARHAEAIALAVKQGQGDLATKQDITLLKSDIDHLRAELKSDIDHLRAELKSDIDHLGTKLSTNIVWIKWVAGANLALSLAIVSAVIVLLQ